MGKIILLAVLLFSFTGFGQQSSFYQQLSQMEKHLSSEKDFTGFVMVRNSNLLLYAKGFGFAEKSKRKVHTRKTLFDTGSVTKQYVTTALLYLEEKGQLSIDDPVSKYYTFTAKKDDKLKQAITLRSLMNHTSGLDYANLSDATYEKYFDKPEILFAKTLAAAPIKSPGTFFYNNQMYNLLAHVVESVSQKPFDDFMSQLFTKLKLKQTGSNGQKHLNTKESAMGYERGKSFFLAGEIPHGWGFRGATGIVTNADELDLWVRAVFSGKKLIGPNQLKQLIKTPKGSPYALGWFVDPKKGFVSHSGSTYGFSSYVVFDPASDLSYIAYSNDPERARDAIYKAAEFLF